MTSRYNLVYWTRLSHLIIRRDADPVPMARLLGELYSKHMPNWTLRLDKCDANPLKAAIEVSNRRLVETLLDAGFKPSMRFTEGSWPWKLAVYVAKQTGDDSVQKLLEGRGVHLMVPVDLPYFPTPR